MQTIEFTANIVTYIHDIVATATLSSNYPNPFNDETTIGFSLKNQTEITIEVYDIPGLGTSDDGKLRITNSFLNEAKNNDALFYVVRQFKEESVLHPMNKVGQRHSIWRIALAA